MIDSMSKAEVALAERFERIGIAADAVTAAKTRDDFARWLSAYFDLDPNRTNDLVLAINEALANSAEHAYSAGAPSRTTDVCASYDPVGYELTVTVADRGLWRTSHPTPGNRNRGRGIPLMTALSDRANIRTSTVGTQVVLTWVDVHWR